MTAAIRSICLLRWRPWPRYLTLSTASRQHPCSVPGSRHSTRCATAALCPETWLACKASAVWGTSASSTRGGSVTTSPLSGGSENAALAKKLGANVYIDSNATNAAAELQRMGGAQVILSTAPSSKAMSTLIDGLGPNGKIIVLGAAFDPIEVTPIQLISGSRAVQGWLTGTPADSEDTLHFSELTGIRPMIETYPLEQAAEAYARMLSGDAQFRVVLTM